MRERLRRFLYGRYGADRLSRHLLAAGLALCAVSLFIRFTVTGQILYVLAIALFGYGYFRIMSKNIMKRRGELIAYERVLKKIKWDPAGWRMRFRQRKLYRIFKCPQCGQKLRIPKGRGKVEIRCRKCGNVFVRKS